MSLIAVGLSHRSAPLPLLERASLGAADPALRRAILAGGNVDDLIVIATCNRIEVYADSRRFHGGVADVAAALARTSEVDLDTLASHLYAYYDSAAVEHLFTVTAGLDSMALGESQILGQVRTAWQAAHHAGPGPVRELDEAFQQALRVGKRAQSETGLDRLGNALVEAACDRAETILGGTGRRIVVVGAGAMAALIVTTLGRRPDAAADRTVTVVSRTMAASQRLTTGAGASVDATAARWDDLAQLLTEADLVFSCTGAVGHVLDARTVATARTGGSAGSGRPLVLVDLALPRDIDPLADHVDGVTVVDLELLGAELSEAHGRHDVAEARAIVADEVGRWRAERAAADVAPTVVALREQAATILDAELARLRRRLPDMSSQDAAEVERAVRRAVEKVLHTPTVRVKQLADAPGGSFYAEALATLFDLDVSDVTTVDRVLAGGRP